MPTSIIITDNTIHDIATKCLTNLFRSTPFLIERATLIDANTKLMYPNTSPAKNIIRPIVNGCMFVHP